MMCSLALFPPPLPGDGETSHYYSKDEFTTDPSVWFEESHALNLYFPRESLKPHSRPESSSKAAFRDHCETLYTRSAGAWRDAGLSGLLNEIANSSAEVPKWLGVSSRCVLALLQWVSSFHGSLFPHLTLSSEEMTAEFSQVLDWSDCAVRGFAWHPHTQKCAVALLDDSIKIYNPKSSTSPTLKHRLQRSVAALQWKPLCASDLAVACHNCLLVWHVDPTSLSTRPSSGCAQVLSHPGHSPVTSVAWSPSGSLLVSASPRDTAMLVWDVAVESCVPLHRVGGGGVTHISWSPDGSRLMAATPSSLFRVWETRMWTCERWPSLKGRCQSGCWSPDGSRLLFTVQGETVIYALTFTDTPGLPLGMSGGPKAATVVADLSETSLDTPDGDTMVGGEIQSLAWDPRGERLAVLLKGDAGAGRPAMIAVFKTQINPAFKLLPCGFVQGEPGTEPRLMQFNPNFRHGAQLTVCWSNGKITHVAFYFMSARVPQPGVGGSPPLPISQGRPADYVNQTLYTELIS
ncbi:aladin [Esox lucius]|uniref:Aladin seven-bladed propeller domain-containing protein n=1 Tax=Esox lucius TaxID=8010 RepID=A0A3P8YF22_ESOLU|nr:aladin [Esox lucius]